MKSSSSFDNVDVCPPEGRLCMAVVLTGQGAFFCNAEKRRRGEREEGGRDWAREKTEKGEPSSSHGCNQCHIVFIAAPLLHLFSKVHRYKNKFSSVHKPPHVNQRESVDFGYRNTLEHTSHIANLFSNHQKDEVITLTVSVFILNHQPSSLFFPPSLSPPHSSL